MFAWGKTKNEDMLQTVNSGFYWEVGSCDWRTIVYRVSEGMGNLAFYFIFFVMILIFYKKSELIL